MARFDGKNTKQIATSLKITEWSGVTRGAHDGAHVTICKVADDQVIFTDLVKATFTEALTEQQNERAAREQLEPLMEQYYAAGDALWESNRDAFKDGDTDQVKQNIRDYAMSLMTLAKQGASDYAYVPDPEKKSTWKLPIDTPEHISAAAAALSPGGFRGNRVEIPEADRAAVVARVRAAWLKAYPDKSEDDMPESLKKQEDDEMSDKAEIAKYKALAEMTDAQKAHFHAIDNDESREAFLKMSPEDRDATVDLAKGADEEYETSKGVTLKKSAVGAEVFELLKSQDQDLVKMRNAQEMAEFVKVAGDDLHKHLPGEVLAKAAALRAIGGLSAEVQKTIGEMLKAGNAAIGEEFTVKASGHTKISSAEDTLTGLAKAYAEKHNVSFAKAYDHVMDTPEGMAAFNEANEG